eukprot:2484344-Amphidinium_carterae.2
MQNGSSCLYPRSNTKLCSEVQENSRILAQAMSWKDGKFRWPWDKEEEKKVYSKAIERLRLSTG